MCLPCRCPETALAIRPSRGRCVATTVHARMCVGIVNVLSRARETIDGVWIGNRVY
jgi:hypothetical protein